MSDCRNCVFVTEGTECPECGEISTHNYALEAVRTEERLYGTRYGSGKYDLGLGERIYGKQDRARKMAEKGLIEREPGMKEDLARERKRLRQKDSKALSEVVARNVRRL